MNNIGQLIKQISNILINDMNKRLKEYNLTFSQLQVLLVIEEAHDKICQKDITEILKVKHTTLIDILKVLERKKLITRTASESNAKFTEVALTNKGIEIMQKMDFSKDKTQELMAETLGYFNVEEMLTKFKKVLEKLEEGV